MLEAIFTADSAQIITTTDLGMIECKKTKEKSCVLSNN